MKKEVDLINEVNVVLGSWLLGTASSRSGVRGQHAFGGHKMATVALRTTIQ